MRDAILVALIFGSLPFCFSKTWFGVLMWVWVSLMNPHRLTWGFAYDLPFAMLIAIATVGGFLFDKGPKRFPWSALTITLVMFIVWMNVTTVFALVPDAARTEWTRVMKTMMMLIVLLTVLHGRKHIEWLTWVIALSIGFFGVKGGIFTATGGAMNRVWGPAGSYIEDNNALAAALIMVVPLLWYLRGQAAKPIVRWGLLAAILLTAASALGSYSRGALLALAAMAVFMWFKSSHKLPLAMLMIVAAPGLFYMLPEQWFERMQTIGEYQADSSALGRINAWYTAYNVAKDRPLTGGGFQIWDPAVFDRYAPIPWDVHAAHSIYFAVLGEHGFVGLALFLMLGVLTWTTARWIVKQSRPRPELAWAANLAEMCQVSLIGYAVGGAFLSLSYYDLPYYIMAVLVLLRRHVAESISENVQRDPARERRASPMHSGRGQPELAK